MGIDTPSDEADAGDVGGRRETRKRQQPEEGGSSVGRERDMERGKGSDRERDESPVDANARASSGAESTARAMRASLSGRAGCSPDGTSGSISRNSRLGPRPPTAAPRFSASPDRAAEININISSHLHSQPDSDATASSSSPSTSPRQSLSRLQSLSVANVTSFTSPFSNLTPALPLPLPSLPLPLPSLSLLPSAMPSSLNSQPAHTPIPAPFSPFTTYSPLLQCPACPPSSILVAPTTLHCGHTVCSKHVKKHPSGLSPLSPADSPTSSRRASSSSTSISARLARLNTPDSSSKAPIVPSCPLPTCHPNARHHAHTLNIPRESPVAYYPPLIQPTGPGPASGNSGSDPNLITVADPRVDVSVTRVLELLEKYQVSDENACESRELVEEEDEATDEDIGEEVEEERDKEPGALDHQTDMTPGLSGLSDNPDNKHPHSLIEPSPHPRRTERRKSRASHNHPRKRLRTQERLDEDTRRPGGSSDPESTFMKELTESLTCEICYMLLYQPVTTPCQHTFCAKCFERSLDHGSKCPLCRQDMPPFSYFQEHPYNKVIYALLLKAFPDTYADRGRVIEIEERDARLKTPLFVCQLSFPGMPTLLHFFEPRYRLMLRRCLESTPPCFGMIMPPRVVGSSGNDYGTMLEIRSVQMLPDGRSMVETWGTYRFRILERGTLDGYMVGRIERVDDVPGDLEDEAERHIASLHVQGPNQSDGTNQATTSLSRSSSLQAQLQPLLQIPPAGLQPTNEELVAICHAFIEQLRDGTAPWVVQRLNNTYGPMPSDPSSFSFWMALVLPIDDHEKAKLLPIKSARMRLRLVVHWIEKLNSNWWFSSGCCIA